MGSTFVRKVEQIVAASPLVVFSKTTCGYCSRAKSLLNSLNAKFDAVDLDKIDSGSQMQKALAEITGQRTVPNIFMKGNSIGGCDDLMKLHSTGVLEQKLKEIGVL
mmetsp:Transcript_13123/g.24932  ORF Transcript_13123/g.24932 Transcript_13123/m.24932 type:complete len:106 (-) Transcript_13123:615-932(-)